MVIWFIIFRSASYVDISADRIPVLDMFLLSGFLVIVLILSRSGASLIWLKKCINFRMTSSWLVSVTNYIVIRNVCYFPLFLYLFFSCFSITYSLLFVILLWFDLFNFTESKLVVIIVEEFLPVVESKVIGAVSPNLLPITFSNDLIFRRTNNNSIIYYI